MAPRPQDHNAVDDREHLFREKLANWMETVGLGLEEPTTFRPTIVRGDRVQISEGGDVYELPETLFYENVKKWAVAEEEEEDRNDQVKLPVPRSVFYASDNW